MMKLLIVFFSFILFGVQPTFQTTSTLSLNNQSPCIVIDTNDICSCCSLEWMSQKYGDKTLYQVKFKNNCSYTVQIHYKYRSDNDKLVPIYYEIGAGKTTPWLPTGYEKHLYSYSEK